MLPLHETFPLQAAATSPQTFGFRGVVDANYLRLSRHSLDTIHLYLVGIGILPS